MNKNTSIALESLRTFAAVNHEIGFAHLCTSALNGEQWAMDRLAIDALATFGAVGACEATLSAIRATDTTRPDGLVARGCAFAP